MMLHPNAERLLQFAEGVTPESDQGRMTDHLARCERCRSEVSGIREVQQLLVLTLEPAPEELLAQVMDSRARNELVLLPVGNTDRREVPRTNRRIMVLVGVGVAAIALLVLVPSLPFPAARSVDAAPAVEIVPKEPVAPPLAIDPSRLHPMELWYETKYIPINRNEPIDFDRYRVKLEPINNANRDWRLVQDDGGSRYATRDTVILSGRDLRPLERIESVHRTDVVGGRGAQIFYRTRHTFTDSTLTFQKLLSPPGYDPNKEGTIPLSSSGGSIPSGLPWMLSGPNELAVLMAIPFPAALEGWSGGAASVRVIGRKQYVNRVEYRSVAGTSDPKTITLERLLPIGVRETRYLLRRSDGLMLRRTEVYRGGDSVIVRLVSVR